MIPETLALVLIGLGCVLIVAAFVAVWRGWGTVRIPPRAVPTFYAGAILVVIGLQPLRPFRLRYATNLMPSGETARSALIADLQRGDWIVGVAKPSRLADADHPLQPEIAARFERYRAEHPMLDRADGPDFLFAARKISGWSRNPRTTALTFIFLGFVFTIAAARYVVRLVPPRRA